LVEEVRAAGLWHDCGKLCRENQEVLRSAGREKLPVRHSDGGAALLLGAGREIGGMLVQSHHEGLPAVLEERAGIMRRPPCEPFRDRKTREHTEQRRPEYEARYAEAGIKLEGPASVVEAWPGLAHRIALSCLVDGDHTDTARNYRESAECTAPAGRWLERLASLDSYIRDRFDKAEDRERAKQRMGVYESCKAAGLEPSLRSCEAAVGTGKTTAVMAHLLRVAHARGLRHIFVVLPYTNIISQSVKVYRKALVLAGEDAQEVIAELHHLADFDDLGVRHLAALWRAPVIVTTAVQFFETLAAAEPKRLRKLHELPGSAAFIDEAHAAIPTALWPQTWRWLRELAESWGCRFVLGSGSLVRFWEVPGLTEQEEHVPDLLPADLQSALNAGESSRVVVRRAEQPMNVDELAGFVGDLEGPRLVILNTVQNAAVFADRLRRGQHEVEHLSTALAPTDRERIVQRVRDRLADRAQRDWTLVATSCVEAGVDFSFRSAVRESASAASVIQTGGRVNREGLWAACEVWDVRLQDPLFNSHPQFRHSRAVLGELFEEGEVKRRAAAELVTEAMRRELMRHWEKKGDELKRKERLLDFPAVAESYQVIEGDTRVVVIDKETVRRLEARERVSTRELLRVSVQMWPQKIEALAIREIPGYPGLYQWTGPYDPEFLGYMDGVLPLIRAKKAGGMLSA
jgi:CRISPR-associated endonuclease/helicase Cas3